MRDSRIILIVALSAVLGCVPLPDSDSATRQVTARTFRVLRIVDGDTFKIRYDGDVVSVRIYDIDAPERGRDGFAESTAALAALIEDKDVRLVFCGRRRRDHYGRLLARIFVGKLEVGPEMIRLGQAVAWDFGS